MEYIFIYSIEVKSVLLCMWREKNRKIQGEKSSPPSKATTNNDKENISEKNPRSKTRTDN